MAGFSKHDSANQIYLVSSHFFFFFVSSRSVIHGIRQQLTTRMNRAACSAVATEQHWKGAVHIAVPQA